MLVLFFILTLLSVLLLIVGLASPKLVLRWGRRRTRRQSITVYGSATVIFAIVLFVTWTHSAHSSNAAYSADWNTANLDATSNGNIPRAVTWLQATPHKIIRSTAVSPSAAMVFKKPSEFYGQIVKLTGKVSSVHPWPDKIAKGLGGTASELNIVTNDGTHIEFFLAGNNKQVNPGDTISLYGYPVGHGHTTSNLGGNLAAVVVIGDALDDPAN